MRKLVNLKQASGAKGPAGGTRHRADAETTRLMRLVESQRYADVERVAREYLARNGRHPLALKALSFALVGLRRFEEVLPVTEFALKQGIGDGEVHNNRAIALAELMRWDEALPEFRSALALLPDDCEIHKNYGVALFRLHRWNEAIPCLLKAIELHPGDYLDAISILARALFYARRLEEAYVVCQTLCAEYPDSPGPLHRLLTVELHRCSWSDFDVRLNRLAGMLRSQVLETNPWELFKYRYLDMEDLRRQAVVFAKAMVPESLWHRRRWDGHRLETDKRPLRIGYLSSDFLEHPVTFVISELIERHHRDVVHVTGYSLRADDGGAERKRLVAAFDDFVDLERLGVNAVAERIRADRIDILVDLNGWTGYQRTEALALRCAPVQVSWLGYAGTLGLESLADFIVGDAEATPLAHQPYYTERIVQMPHTFMPVDTRYPVAPTPSRSSQGLPDDAFVLCSLNNSYKLNPKLFDIWCRLLAKMPDAVLWLLRTNDTVVTNLRSEAEARGISGDRLIFASRVPSRSDYLARIGLADLALDAFPYNSHSTGVDVLISGVPMVAVRGATFPGRVGASLLRAAGLPELIAADEAGYEALVLELYADRSRLADLRRRLAEARHSAPLFDMEGFAHDLEALYIGMATTMAQTSPPDAPARPVPVTGP